MLMHFILLKKFLVTYLIYNRKGVIETKMPVK